jgi:hypothetical protein
MLLTIIGMGIDSEGFASQMPAPLLQPPRIAMRRVALIAFLMLFPALIAMSQTPSAARKACPVTPAPQTPFTPKGALSQPGGAFFFGTPTLSVLLSHSWTQSQSVRWFSDDAAVPAPVNLKITGRRLDPDVAFVADPNLRDSAPKFSQGPAVATRGNLMLSTVVFPTAGCWEITARMNDAELRFVTYIAPTR